MTLPEFRTSLHGDAPPHSAPLLKAMWHDAKGDWAKAHEICQEIDTKDASLVHAYLHRKEGDLSNASYWYRLAGEKVPSVALEREWEMIVAELLQHS